MYIHLCGSLIGDVALFIEAGGEELLLYRLHRVKRDISKALSAASLGDTVPGGDSEPDNNREIIQFEIKKSNNIEINIFTGSPKFLLLLE